MSFISHESSEREMFNVRGIFKDKVGRLFDSLALRFTTEWPRSRRQAWRDYSTKPLPGQVGGDVLISAQ